MEERTFKAAPEIKQDDFLKFLSKKTAAGVCAACNETDFAVIAKPLSEDGDDSEFVAILKTPILETDLAYITAAVSCKNCGWIRHHGVGEIIEFIDSEKSQQDLALANSNSDTE